MNFARGKADGPTYLAIAGTIRSSIKKGQLLPGEALPSLRDLARQTGAHRHTVMAALHELLAEGWLESAQRKSYFVSKELPSKYFLDSKKIVKTSKLVVSEGRYSHSSLASTCKYNFQSGLADLRLFPIDELRSFLNEGLKRNPLRLLSYGDPVGHTPLIEQLSEYLRRMRGIIGRNLIVTHGSQEGIYLLAHTLIKPGDGVAVEALGYPPAWDCFRSAGAKLYGVELDSKGIIPESFEKLVTTKGIRLLYTTPLHQYPTTVTLPMDRRMKIYEIAKRNKCLILEDDYDHEFHFRSNPIPPLASDDPEGIVVYVSTFSKILFPSSRIGFMAVPDKYYGALRDLKRTTSRQNETLLQDAVARWMKDGGFERHLRKMRRHYHERRDAIIECVESAKVEGFALSCTPPDGGMAIWLECHANSQEISEDALKSSIFVSPESFYQLKQGRGTHLRLGFAVQTPAEIKSGMKKLIRLLPKSDN